ncbi:hypothetical protein [Kitasatospora sp. NPDC002040]|uniref:hypothetical protein n=1 Tax=Kitasatospora sp. NPDC002040 TaxID=3154661 RepID=UPI003333D500
MFVAGRVDVKELRSLRAVGTAELSVAVMLADPGAGRDRMITQAVEADPKLGPELVEGVTYILSVYRLNRAESESADWFVMRRSGLYRTCEGPAEHEESTGESKGASFYVILPGGVTPLCITCHRRVTA